MQQDNIFGSDESWLDIMDEQGGAFMRLPSGFRDQEALLSVIGKVKGGQGAWIAAGELHLPGPGAPHVLAKLSMALKILRALGVSDEKAALDVLRVTPALMVDTAKRRMSFTLSSDGACLKGDARWLQSLIAGLACHSPSLACRVVLDLLTPRARWTLLSHHPATFDALVARVEDEQDREALRVYFERGLASEMKKPRGAPYVAVWMARCPPWAEASLNRIWSTHGDESITSQWMLDDPALGEILTRWRMSCSTMSVAPIDGVDRQQVFKVDPIGSADAGRIREQFAIILLSVRGRNEVRELRYGEALTQCGLPSHTEEDRATRARFLFHCALSAVSAELMVTKVESEALEWLLARLFKDFRRDFCAVAASALVHRLANPSARQLALSENLDDKPVEFSDDAHVLDIVRRMVGWCHQERAFQSRLPLQKAVKDTLAVMAGEDLFVWLAPTGQKDGFRQAAWKMRLLWRDEWLSDQGLQSNDLARSLETATILKLALAQEDRDGIPDRDMDGIVSCVLQGESSAWVQSLLGLNPFDTAQQKFRSLIACLAVKCASNAYDAGNLARATEFVAMLCKCRFVLDDDLGVASWSMAAGAALTLEAVRALRAALSSDPRGLERMYLWVYCLDRAVQADESGRVAEAVKYLDDTCEGYDFRHLKENGTKVRDLFQRYRADPRGHDANRSSRQVVTEEGGACLRLSPAWENMAFLSALKTAKGVQGEPWISRGTLHLQGPRAVHVLSQVALALEVLTALGMRHEEDVLRVLLDTPTWMVDVRAPGVTFTVTADRLRLTGDVQWLQSVILDLASHAPSVACLVFLCLAAEDQWTMLTRYPPSFDVLVARTGDEVDRESLLAHFQWGLASELKKQDLDPKRVEVWVARCPLWAEPTLYNVLVDCGRQTADAWPVEHPKLRQVLERWDKAYAPKTAARAAKGGVRLNPDPEALLARYQPDTMLWRVRSAKYPVQGSLVWRTGVRYIRHQFHEILRGADGREPRYGNAVEMINCLRRDNQAELFFASAFIVLSFALKHGTLRGEARDWLLDRLHKHFNRHFSIAAAHSFAHHLPWLLEDHRRASGPRPTCRMHLPWGDGSLAIPFAQPDDVTQVLTHLIARCRADGAFQSSLPLQKGVQQGLMELSKSQSPNDVLKWLGLTEGKDAPWKVQLLLRYPRSQSTRPGSDPTAAILKNALVQETDGIREADMDDIVAYVLQGASAAWIKGLLEQYPKDEKYRTLIVGLVVKCASKTYERNGSEANGLIALLCESKIVTGADFQATAKYMTAPRATERGAITELARVLALSSRAQQRMCLWICHLLSSLPADQASGVADTVQQLDAAYKKSSFGHLEGKDRDMVRAFFERYRLQKEKVPT
ncbi:hypothetical protein GCM10023165_12540 [Variovorax defluvii]|uniref:Uncharacterized protein n=1 Tax=Variovorax defluvii TaxID=913761 RepID=A0ABP8H8G1_9BURK